MEECGDQMILHSLFFHSEDVLLTRYSLNVLENSVVILCQKQPLRGVLKICNKFTGEHPCRSVISRQENTHVEV